MKKFNCDVDGGIIVTCAVRYALGRKSYVPSTIRDWLNDHWNDLTPNIRQTVLRDIIEYAHENKDNKTETSFIEDWLTFAVGKYHNLDRESQNAIYSDLKYNQGFKSWFDDNVVFHSKSQKKRLESLQRLSDLDQELGF
jgi:hypothetical protein